ncbi:MAG: hypothetical protein OCD00_05080 [Colwellia sp.]
MSFKPLFFLFAVFFTISTAVAENSQPFGASNKLFGKEQVIAKINLLVRQNKETLIASEVIQYSGQIIQNRLAYPTESVAKAFLLLANIATNQGDTDKAFQFTQDGLAVNTSNDQIKLCLLLKLAEISTTRKQYQQLLSIAEQAVTSTKNNKEIKYNLFALSYRSVAYALLSQHQKALADLQQVEKAMLEHPTFADHIELLDILSTAHYHLGDYQTALTLQQKILKLRFDLDKKHNIEHTYYRLAIAYQQLEQSDDAYNAFLEAKIYAQEKPAPISMAYASHGLGMILFQQQSYQQAHNELQQAKKLFKKHHLTKEYLETIIDLVKVHFATQHPKKAYELLKEAELLSLNTYLEPNYFELFQLLANMYHEQGDNDNAFFWQKKFLLALQAHTTQPKVIAAKGAYSNNQHLLGKLQNNEASDRSRNLALKLAEKSELSTTFTRKFQRQQRLINTLMFIISLLLIFMITQWFILRTKKQKRAYEEENKPSHIIATATQTKQLYQQAFNKSRKYQYPLTLAYFSIDNWQELAFTFNRKTVNEVGKYIARIINEYLNEFEYAGLINDGEYLLLFPHQNQEDVTDRIEKLTQAITTRFFANLGNFSITISFTIEMPNYQDIDPYIFLSRLSDSNHIDKFN